MAKEQRVLLINAEETRSRFDFKGIIDDEPLELEVIYTVLKHGGIKVKIYDFLRCGDVSLEDEIKKFKPTITYVNGVVKQVPFMMEYNERVKNISKKIKTIIGGVYAEHNYEKLYSDNLDYVCRSYDPNVILKIAEYESGKKISLNKLNGLCFRKDNKWQVNKIEPFDINNLPLTDRTYFYDHIDEFRYLELTKIAQVRTSYSCPYKCKFCYRTSLNCGKYVAKDIEKVVKPLMEGKADACIGARPFKDMPLSKSFANGIMNFLTLVFYGCNVRDSQGGLRAFTAETASQIDIVSSGYGVSSEFIKEISDKNFRLEEVTITTIYTPETQSKGTDAIVGLKILFKMVLDLFRI